MKRALSKTTLFITIALIFVAGIYSCKKTTTSGSQAGGTAAAGTEKSSRASSAAAPTQDPVKEWYKKEEKVFTLTTAGELAGLAKLVSGGNRFKGKTIVLGADIDLSGYHAKSKFNEGKGWVPIGNKNAMFKGTFDGSGRTVRGIYINDPMLFYAGLFGRIDSAAIRNVKVADVNITAHSRAGAVAGGMGNSTIIDCMGSGQIKAGAYVGGVSGYARRKSSISESYSSANVKGNNYIGGIAGEIDGASKAAKSHSSGSVVGEMAVGGIAGVVNKGSSVSNSFSSAKVTTGSKGGGIAGQVHQGASVRNCYSIGEVSGRTFVGGIAGQAGQEGKGEPEQAKPAAQTKQAKAKQPARPQARPAAQPAQITDTLSNNAALNPSVKASVGVAGRVQGHNNSRLTMIRNIAFGGLTNNAGNTEWAAKGDRGRDGNDITKEEIMTDPTFGGRFTTQNGWIIEDGRLPGLKETVPIPQHLR